jgi:hypothetical protein
MFFAFIQVFLSQSTIDKFKLLYGPENLKEFIDDDQITQELQGTSPFKYNPYAMYGFERPEADKEG